MTSFNIFPVAILLGRADLEPGNAGEVVAADAVMPLG